MKIFDAAYLRLTAWYVAIIMTISLLFSFWLYNQARQELRFGLNKFITVEPYVNFSAGVPSQSFQGVIDDRLDASRQRLLGRLIFMNAVVLGVGAAASYWLARRTMQPVEEAVAAQERFTADAAHELRTPLAAMKAEIEVGLRDKKLTKDEAVDLLQSNLEEIDRLGGLAEGLLALTQTDEPDQLVPISLEEVAGAVARRMQPLAHAKQIEIQRELEPVIVAGNEAALDKIIGILVDNAIKYSPAGTSIALKTYQRDGSGYLEVHDHGIGIKATELAHIFDRFYRADSSRSKLHVAGHGLGLSIAQKLAETLNAKIEVSSTPGKGSIFAFKLSTT